MLTGLSLLHSQRMVLSPRLRQSLEILQLPTADLIEEIRKAVDENPLLEMEERPPVEEAREEKPGEAAPERRVERDEREDNRQEEPTSRLGSELDFGSQSWGEPESEDYVSPIDRAAAPVTLSSHLARQASFLRCGEAERDKVLFLIGELDEDGFLDIPLSEISSAYADQTGLAREGEAAWSGALELLRSLDPAGVGAYSQREALVLQVRSRLREARGEEARILGYAERALESALAEIAKKDFQKLRRILDCGLEDIERVFDVVASLDPRPASRFRNDPVHQVVPDVLVLRDGGRWRAFLNPASTPILRLNPELSGYVKSAGAKAGDWKPRLTEARAFMQSVEHRYETTLRVASAVVARQQRFFNEGEGGLVPMRLADIAADTGLHESTISRATNGKYLQSPRGVHEMKHLFSSHVASDVGDQVSSRAVRAAIKKLVSEEDPLSPLSDGKLSAALEEAGFHVARRTVAKYREQEKIPAASLRKRFR